VAAIVAYLVKIKGKDQQAIPPAVGLRLPLVLEGTLRLSTPQLVSGHFHDAEAVSLFSHVGHSPWLHQ
jgi:hypothetical protein